MKKNYQPFLIMPDGSTKNVNPKNGTDFSLEELQEFVGGYIEIVRLGNGEIMVVNEEGKLKNLPINKVATMFCRFMRDFNDHLVGNVLVCHTSMVKYTSQTIKLQKNGKTDYCARCRKAIGRLRPDIEELGEGRNHSPQRNGQRLSQVLGR